MEDEKIEEEAEFAYNQIYMLFKIPMRLEKYLFWQMIVFILAVLYYLVIVPFRSILALLSLFLTRRLKLSRKS
jgi:hypothetical protein